MAKKLNAKELGLTTELGVLVEIYNKSITNVVTLQTRHDLFQSLEIINPENTKHAENKKVTGDNLKIEKKLLSIVSDRILNIDKKKNEQ